MANYYTKFSFVVRGFTPEQITEIMRAYRLLHQSKVGDAVFPQDSNYIPAFKDLGDDGRESLLEELCFDLEQQDDGLWFHDDEGSGMGSMDSFIQCWLVEFNLPFAVGYEWSNDCDKPRVDAFGGGAVLITKTAMYWTNTGEWLCNKCKEMGAVNAAPR